MAIENKPSGSSCNSSGFAATSLPPATLLGGGLGNELNLEGGEEAAEGWRCRSAALERRYRFFGRTDAQ